MLLTLLFEPLGFSCVPLRLIILIEPYGCFLVLSILSKLLRTLPFLFRPLLGYRHFLVALVQVPLAHFHNFDCFFLGILDFFPCLKKK